MGDKGVGKAHARLQVEHQIDDLRLDRHVKGRDRLVGNDELGSERKRAAMQTRWR